MALLSCYGFSCNCLLQLCGHDIHDSSENESSAHEISKSSNENGFTLNSPPTNNRFSQSEESKHQQQMTLIQEFSLVNQYIPNVTIEKVRNQVSCREPLLNVVILKYLE